MISKKDATQGYYWVKDKGTGELYVVEFFEESWMWMGDTVPVNIDEYDIIEQVKPPVT